MTIIGTEVKKFDGLFGADGKKLELVGEAVPIVVEEPKKEEEVKEQSPNELINDNEHKWNGEEKEMTEEEKVLAEVARLQAELEALKKDSVALSAKSNGGSNVKKNQKPGKANASRKYVLLDKELKSWGKVPQQQADLAAIMAESMEVGSEWTEEELFDLITTGAKEYTSLRNSTQDPTYLFRYYRGLKNDGKHAGFVARGFLRMF